jgi:hypothetical protein
MTFLQQIQAHKGGLICLKTQLYWYGGRGYDNTPGRICLVLDIAATRSAARTDAATTPVSALKRIFYAAETRTASAHLLIDGVPQWIWLADENVELL